MKSKNLARNAVKTKNLAKNAVTSGKLKKNAVTNAKLADGSVNFAKIAAGTNVIASATAGPVAADQDGPVNLLSSPIVVTPVAGQPLTVEVEARGTLSGKECQAVVFPRDNGSLLAAGELLVLAAPDEPPTPPFGEGIRQADVAFPVGLTQPGTPQSITLDFFGDKEDCKAGSTLDQVAVVVTQAK